MVTVFDIVIFDEGIVYIMQRETGLDVITTYSYARIYKKGDILKRHKR